MPWSYHGGECWFTTASYIRTYSSVYTRNTAVCSNWKPESSGSVFGKFKASSASRDFILPNIAWPHSSPGTHQDKSWWADANGNPQGEDETAPALCPTGYNAWRCFCGPFQPQNLAQLSRVLNNEGLARKFLDLHRTLDNCRLNRGHHRASFARGPSGASSGLFFWEPVPKSPRWRQVSDPPLKGPALEAGQKGTRISRLDERIFFLASSLPSS